MATSRRTGELSIQSVGDFFKSANRNILIVTWLTRLIAIAFLYILMNTIWGILDDKVTGGTSLFGMFGNENLKTLFKVLILFFFVIFVALMTIAVLVTIPVSSAITASSSGSIANEYFNSARAFILTNLFGDIDPESIDGFEKGVFLDSSDPLTPLAYLLNKPQRNLYNSEALYGFIIILFILMLITGIGFIRRSSVQLAGATLVISQIIIGLAFMKDLTIPLTLDASELSTLFDTDKSPLFQLALISYLYFEFSLQTGYLYTLATPTLTRQKRVGTQLSKLSEFRLGVTKLGTEEEQKTAKERKTREAQQAIDDGDQKTSTALATSGDSTAAKKFGADALLFLLDSAQDSLFSKPGGEQERLTGRLQRYHDGLLAHDPKIDDKLGGSGEKSFRAFTIFFIVITSMIVRVAIIVVLSFLSLNPDRVLAYIALPPTVTNSLEIQEPEGILLVLIPMIFFIIGISIFLTKLQEYIVKAEELIIQEADIAKILRAGKAIKSRKDMAQVEARIAEQKAEDERKAGVIATSTKGKRKKRRRGSKK